MSDERRERDRIVVTLLAQAAIPVPEAEIGKLAEMYFSAEEARRNLRSPRFGETEPMIVFAAGKEGGDD